MHLFMAGRPTVGVSYLCADAHFFSIQRQIIKMLKMRSGDYPELRGKHLKKITNCDKNEVFKRKMESINYM